jgi:hypothetical protein
MSRRRKKTPEERARDRAINAAIRAHGALAGKRTLRRSFNIDDLTLIIVNLAWAARCTTAEQKQELFAVCKRLWPGKSGWLEGLFAPKPPAAPIEPAPSNPVEKPEAESPRD